MDAAPPDRGRLAGAWHASVRAAGCASGERQVAAAGERLLASYAEPHRAYHDLRHLAEVLARVDLLAAEASDPVAVQLAAWFHDAVYDGTAEAEVRSARLAEAELTALGVPERLVTEVARLVRLTAAHGVAAGDADGAVLADADLGILAESPERYAEYAADVRREYASVPDAEFAAGRAAVLERLAGRERLFSTPAGSRWEAAARRNVEAELAQLRERAAGGGAGRPPAAG